jgi:sugar lactone lactonase YvrE
VVAKKDGTIWFSDPSYGIMGDNEGIREPQEQATYNVYMVDPKTANITAVITDMDQPNGLCFSPDEKLFYVTDTGKPHIRVYDVSSDNKLTNERMFHEYAAGGGLSDDIRCDEDGNIWSAGAGPRIRTSAASASTRRTARRSAASCCRRTRVTFASAVTSISTASSTLLPAGRFI